MRGAERASTGWLFKRCTPGCSGHGPSIGGVAVTALRCCSCCRRSCYLLLLHPSCCPCPHPARLLKIGSELGIRHGGGDAGHKDARGARRANLRTINQSGARSALKQHPRWSSTAGQGMIHSPKPGRCSASPSPHPCNTSSAQMQLK